MKVIFGLLLLVTTPFLSAFDFSQHNIPIAEIKSGGPPKDGIPALLHPKFVSADRAGFLQADDRVLALVYNGEAKAYPIKILNWHEVVNDDIGGKPVFVSYCPLCGTGMAFDARIRKKRYTFGVSGLLYQSDVLMYDHQSESLWSQIKQEAVTGALTGTRLSLLPLIHTTWGAWKREYPKSQVLSTETGYSRNYSRDPYAEYAQTDRLMFSVNKRDRRYPPKSWVLGIQHEGETMAYPFSELERGPRFFRHTLGPDTLHITYDPDTRTVRVQNPQGEDLPSVVAYWFAWAAFHPQTQVYTHPSSKK